MKIGREFTTRATYYSCVEITPDDINFALHEGMGNSEVELTEDDIKDIITNWNSKWFDHKIVLKYSDGGTLKYNVGDYVFECIADIFAGTDCDMVDTEEIDSEEYTIET